MRFENFKLKNSDDEKYFELEDDGWYFWDETWTRQIGPYHFKTSCILAFYEYCKKTDEEFNESLNCRPGINGTSSCKVD